MGAITRYWFSRAAHAWLGLGFPYGTLGVNVTGSFAIGLVWALLVGRFGMGPEGRALIMVGFLGAFTTFSSFSLETLRLAEQSGWWLAGLNVMSNVVLCLGASAAGLWMGRVA